MSPLVVRTPITTVVTTFHLSCFINVYVHYSRHPSLLVAPVPASMVSIFFFSGHVSLMFESLPFITIKLLARHNTERINAIRLSSLTFTLNATFRVSSHIKTTINFHRGSETYCPITY